MAMAKGIFGGGEDVAPEEGETEDPREMAALDLADAIEARDGSAIIAAIDRIYMDMDMEEAE
jgi:hypothetical protein